MDNLWKTGKNVWRKQRRWVWGCGKRVGYAHFIPGYPRVFHGQRATYAQQNLKGKAVVAAPTPPRAPPRRGGHDGPTAPAEPTQDARLLGARREERIRSYAQMTSASQGRTTKHLALRGDRDAPRQNEGKTNARRRSPPATRAEDDRAARQDGSGAGLDRAGGGA